MDYESFRDMDQQWSSERADLWLENDTEVLLDRFDTQKEPEIYNNIQFQPESY
jgi:hypothetical protein